MVNRVTRVFAGLVVMALVVFGGCSGSEYSSSSVIQSMDLKMFAGAPYTVAVTAGGSTGSYSIMGPGFTHTTLAAFDTTDLGVTVFNDSIFVYGKYDADWLARFELDDTLNPVYQYSLVDDSVDFWSMNPSVVEIITDDVGYVFRYGSSTAWIIDPSPVDEAAFHPGDIDLSAYETQYEDWQNPGTYFDAVPNPVKVIVDGNVMYVLLERSNGWNYDVTSMLLTIDISTPAAPVITDAFDLLVVSANSMDLQGTDLYIAGWGTLGYVSYSIQHIPTGGIEKVDLSGGVGAYTSSLLVDDDDGSDTSGNPYMYDGVTTQVVVFGSTIGFIYFSEWNDSVYKIHPFNPVTGVVDTATTILDGINLSQISATDTGLLYCSASAYYGIGVNAGLYILNPASPANVYGPINMGLEPVGFAFSQ